MVVEMIKMTVETIKVAIETIKVAITIIKNHSNSIFDRKCHLIYINCNYLQANKQSTKFILNIIISKINIS